MKLASRLIAVNEAQTKTTIIYIWGDLPERLRSTKIQIQQQSIIQEH